MKWPGWYPGGPGPVAQFSETIFWKAKYLFLMSAMESQLASGCKEEINDNLHTAFYKPNHK